MNHYGEEAISVKMANNKLAYHIIFTNKHTDKRITMRIPRAGAFLDPKKRVTRDSVQSLAAEIAHVLREHLD